jgi:hypothetical protein
MYWHIWPNPPRNIQDGGRGTHICLRLGVEEGRMERKIYGMITSTIKVSSREGETSKLKMSSGWRQY